ncbi:MAG TPA: hypothetical protein VF145_05890 [Chitinophagaceae bacterium]
MKVKENQFPIAVQAYNTKGGQELFVAEQIVYNQAQVDGFTSRHAGMLIKTRLLTDAELGKATVEHKKYVKRRSSASTIFWIILLVLVILVVVGFATGWIQQTFGIGM